MAEKIFAVHYTYDPARSEDLASIRPDHRAFLRELHDAGELLASGPFNGGGEALIVVHASDADAALNLLARDPLNQAGIVTERTATEWNPVIGPWSE